LHILLHAPSLRAKGHFENLPSAVVEDVLRQLADRVGQLESSQRKGFQECRNDTETLRTSVHGKQSDLSRLVSKNAPDIQKLKLGMAGLRQDLKLLAENITGDVHDDHTEPHQDFSHSQQLSKSVELGKCCVV
jgi:hypothetical protein